MRPLGPVCAFGFAVLLHNQPSSPMGFTDSMTRRGCAFLQDTQPLHKSKVICKLLGLLCLPQIFHMSSAPSASSLETSLVPDLLPYSQSGSKMVKVIAGLMGSSVASGSKTLAGSDQLRRLFDMLTRHGIRELDTARVYNHGKSEEDIGNALDASSTFIIETKAPGFSPGSLRYQNVIDNCNASLRALKRDRIDLYYFHGPDSQTPLEESCRAINQLHVDGKISRFGVSNLSADQVQQISEICNSRGWLKPSVYQGMHPNHPNSFLLTSLIRRI